MRFLKLVRKFSLIVQYYIKSNWDDVKAQLKRIVFSYHRSEERAQVLGRVTVLTYHALIVYILSLRLVYHEKRLYIFSISCHKKYSGQHNQFEIRAVYDGKFR